MKVSVIILNWNGLKFLPVCLDSLAAQRFLDFEVVLVDNGSQDGSVEFLRERYPWVKLLALPENTGFAEGNNRGLAAATGEFIVALNNDTRLEPEFLEELVSVALAHPKAMVAAKMLNYYEPGRIDAVALKIGVNGLGYNIGVAELDAGQYDAGVRPFGPCGGAALYRREMLERVGFFDADFFAYYEDFDLAWRGRLAGWDCVSAPRAVVYHVHSATSGEYSRFKVYQTHRNKWYVIAKNWPGGLILRHLASLLFADLASLALACARGRGGAALRARFDFVRNLGELLAKRKGVQALRTLGDPEVEELFSQHEHPLRTLKRKLGKKR